MLVCIHAMKRTKPAPQCGFEINLIERRRFREQHGTRYKDSIALMTLAEVDERRENRCIVLAGAQLACHHVIKLSATQR